MICWNYSKIGHVKRDCKGKKHDKGKSPNATTSIEMKTSSDEVGDVYLESLSTHSCHDAWLINFGASFHMTPHREWFYEYESYDGGDIFLGDDSSYKIIRHGRVKVRFRDGRVKNLPGVLHILGLARNLLSVSKMSDVGIQVIFNKESYKMVQGAMVLTRGVYIGTLYKLQVSTISDIYNIFIVGEDNNETKRTPSSPIEKTMLWHQRMGHIGEKGLRVRKSKGMIEGISNFSLDFEFCKDCMYGKQNQVKFSTSATRANRILQLIHSDVFGPVPIPSLGKSLYYVSFIDDFSRRTWVYFLR